MSRVTFHDFEPRIQSLFEAVVEGLARPDKRVPPKFFYDARGSELFDGICAQPEYYLPDVERTLLHEMVDELAEHTETAGVLIEPGAGSAEKVRLLLDRLRPAAYVPIDISGEHLRRAAERLAADYPWLEIHASCDDFSQEMHLPESVPPGHRLAFFPGSSLGNFEPTEARRFLERLAGLVGHGGKLLIGVDNKKDQSVLHAAYNDAAGMTAEFNRNLLERINRELDADFEPEQFDHEAFYNSEQGRVEMHLISRREQEVHVDGHRFRFEAGERLHTENSYKYRPEEFLDIAAEAGFGLLKHWTDSRRYFSVFLLGVS
jgi:dimethylhistidine N-methyltransferase